VLRRRRLCCQQGYLRCALFFSSPTQTLAAASIARATKTCAEARSSARRRPTPMLRSLIRMLALAAQAVKAKAETEDFTFCNDMVTPKVSLWTACIGTAKAGAAVAAPAAGAAAAGGGGGAAAAAAKAPEPEPEEEEEDMGFDLFD